MSSRKTIKFAVIILQLCLVVHKNARDTKMYSGEHLTGLIFITIYLKMYALKRIRALICTVISVLPRTSGVQTFDSIFLKMAKKTRTSGVQHFDSILLKMAKKKKKKLEFKYRATSDGLRIVFFFLLR